MAALAGCDESGSTGIPGTEVSSAQPRALVPSLNDADRAALRSSNLGFAADAYGTLRQRPDNLVFSPVSMTLAMAMLHAGARGETEAQLAQAMHFELPQARLHPALNWLDSRLASREADDDELTLRVVNASFGQRGYDFLPTYLDVLAENYGAGVSLLDFAGAPENARSDINDWVAVETQDRIPDLLPPGGVTSNTVLALVNAVYFKADWLFPFSPARTSSETFYAPDGEVQVDMMHGRPRACWYYAGDGYQAVALAFRSDGVTEGRGLEMAFILPDEGGFEDFEAALDGALLDEVISGLEEGDVILSLPRFEFSADIDMIEMLTELGLRDAFSNAADFSGINGRRDLVVTEARHEAFISTNETGVEAAAATVAFPEPVSETIRLTFDRPFLFLIRDVETDAPLFLGRVLNPTL